MSLSRHGVEYIASLANIEISKDKLGHFQKQFDGILEYIDSLKTLDVEGVKPLAHVLDLENVTRQDNPKKPLDVDDIIASAPQANGHFFEVPKVIE